MKKVLLVAHCGSDTSRIERVLNSLEAGYEGAFNHEGGLEKLRTGEFALVLPNRVFGYNEDGGIDFIKAMQADEKLKDIPVMLVSGFEDYQQRAVAAGAVRGFGKNELETGGAAKVMQPYLQ